MSGSSRSERALIMLEQILETLNEHRELMNEHRELMGDLRNRLEQVETSLTTLMNRTEPLVSSTTTSHNLSIIYPPTKDDGTLVPLRKNIIVRTLVLLLESIMINLEELSINTDDNDDNDDNDNDEERPPYKQGITDKDWKKAEVLYGMIGNTTKSVVDKHRTDPAFQVSYGNLTTGSKQTLIHELNQAVAVHHVYIDRAHNNWISNYFLHQKVRASRQKKKAPKTKVFPTTQAEPSTPSSSAPTTQAGPSYSRVPTPTDLDVEDLTSDDNLFELPILTPPPVTRQSERTRRSVGETPGPSNPTKRPVSGASTKRPISDTSTKRSKRGKKQ